jgi:lipoprotein LprG
MAGCSHGEDLPPGALLLQRASVAMRDVSSTRFSLQVEGTLGDLGIKQADGVLTRQGEASGTVRLDLGSSLIEYEVVIAGGTYYLKGPTGGFQTVPSILSSQIYDPTRFLDSDTGFAAVLADATDARTTGTDSVEGTSGYRVEARIPTALLEGVVPLEAGQEDTPASLWIGRSEPVLLRVRVETRPEGASASTILTLTLTDPNLTVRITPPQA